MPRVVSKNLFHFVLRGIKDEGVLAEEEKMAQHAAEQAKAFAQMLNASDLEFATSFRPTVDSMMQQINARQFISKAMDACDHTSFKVPARDGNDYDVPVLVHRPKRLPAKNNAAVVYAHGGGAIAGTADDFKGFVSFTADEGGVIYFNVDYRLAPETKCPKNALDFYCAVKHVIENAASLGVDPARIAISGDSGGGYICFATMVMLAQRDEGSLIKLATPGIPMISDYAFSDPAAMTKEEKETAIVMRKIWKCIAEDLDSQSSDPLLYPAKAPDSLIEKMPPTVIFDTEFDFYITESSRMARRMRAAGRLLEFIVIPGATHASVLDPDFECTKLAQEAFKTTINEYLIN